MLAPAIDDFIFMQALRMSQEEILGGATLAARAVNEANTIALRDGEIVELETLGRSGSLTSCLLAELYDEIGQASDPAKKQQSLLQLAQDLKELDDGTATLNGTRLIIGAHRKDFPRGRAKQHQLSVGTHLVVCDSTHENLWSTLKQTELLEQHGCSVQVMVSFDSGDAAVDSEAAPARMYTFEAAISPGVLSGDEKHFQFFMAGMNAQTDQRTAFWSTASEVNLLEPSARRYDDV